MEHEAYTIQIVYSVLETVPKDFEMGLEQFDIWWWTETISIFEICQKSPKDMKRHSVTSESSDWPSANAGVKPDLE